MKLVTQGLLVICMPLIFQFFLSICLVVWIFKAQEDVTSSALSSGLVRQCDLLSNDLYHSLGESFISYNDAAVRSDLQNGTFADRLNEVHKELSAIPAYQDYDRSMMALGTELLEIFRILDTRGKHPDYTAKILSVASQLSGVVAQVVTAENSAHEKKDENKNRLTIIQIVVSATIGSIIITIALATLCALNTRKLVELITANAKRFSRRQPLAEPLPGE